MNEKKKHEPEYTLHVLHTTHPDTSEAVTAFVVQTVREFVSFMYEIPLGSDIKGRAIHLNIHGLRVPENLVPGKGTARGTVMHPKLKGKYELFITNVDGIENRFLLSFTSRAIEVKNTTHKPFIVFSDEMIQI
jgi:hypothetical protein